MASKALEFHPDARAESRTSLRWYRQRSVRAGEAFLDELDQAIEAILRAPERWPVDASGLRRYRLRRFPFLILYNNKPTIVQIVAIAHASRNPGYWIDRQS
jgi:toxin ParE1/3/4